MLGIISTTMVLEVGQHAHLRTTLTPKEKRREWCSGNGYHRYKRHTYSLAVSGQCCEVKQRRAQLVTGWVTQALEQGGLSSCAHAGYHEYYI